MGSSPAFVVPRAAVLGAAVFFGLACRVNIAAADPSTTTDDDNFRPDVLECEDAAQHLQDCCPGFDKSALVCRYYDSVTRPGCTSSMPCRHVHEDPVFTVDESRCIVQSSCESLRANNVCDRAQVAQPDSDDMSSSPCPSWGPSPHPLVCP